MSSLAHAARAQHGRHAVANGSARAREVFKRGRLRIGGRARRRNVRALARRRHGIGFSPMRDRGDIGTVVNA
jgi:hypothetical protein